MKRDFNKWLDTFRSSICDYKFYVDFEKVYGNVDNIKDKGHSENGRITDLTETEVTENNNGCVSNYTIYNLKFEYTDDCLLYTSDAADE